MKKMLKRLCTGFLALATVVTALPTTPVMLKASNTAGTSLIARIRNYNQFIKNRKKRGKTIWK